MGSTYNRPERWPTLKRELEAKRQMRERYERLAMRDTVYGVISGLLKYKTLDRETKERVKRYMDLYPEEIAKWETLKHTRGRQIAPSAFQPW